MPRRSSKSKSKKVVKRLNKSIRSKRSNKIKRTKRSKSSKRSKGSKKLVKRGGSPAYNLHGNLGMLSASQTCGNSKPLTYYQQNDLSNYNLIKLTT